jgi:hypothetical protein
MHDAPLSRVDGPFLLFDYMVAPFSFSNGTGTTLVYEKQKSGPEGRNHSKLLTAQNAVSDFMCSARKRQIVACDMCAGARPECASFCVPQTDGFLGARNSSMQWCQLLYDLFGSCMSHASYDSPAREPSCSKEDSHGEKPLERRTTDNEPCIP